MTGCRTRLTRAIADDGRTAVLGLSRARTAAAAGRPFGKVPEAFQDHEVPATINPDRANRQSQAIRASERGDAAPHDADAGSCRVRTNGQASRNRC